MNVQSMLERIKNRGHKMKKQKGEHATAEKILQAAQEIFLAKGFDGSSINEIADKAKINKSLIYHHFFSKENLWKAVKTSLLQSYAGQDLSQIDFPMDSFKNFLKSFVTLRFKFYDDNPEIVRLISWQRLENNKKNIEGLQNKKFTSIVPQIQEFQQRGEIRSELDPEMIEYFIMTTASMAFMDYPTFFEGQKASENKEKFLELVVENLFLAFSTPRVLKKSDEPRIYS